MAAGNLQLAVVMDTGQADRAVRGFNNTLSGAERNAVRAAGSMRSGFDGLTSSIVKLASTLGVLKAAQAGLNIAMSFERSRIGLEAFLGSAERAKALFADIQKMALKSPFEMKDLLEGTNRLLAFNFKAQEIVPTLDAVSSAMGALGGDRGKVNDLINALGQIRAATKLTGEEMRQLRNAGIPAMDILTQAFGKSAEEIDKFIRKGLVPGDLAIRALVDGMNERFGKFNDAVSKTASVALSNFMDAAGKFADEVLARYLPAITRFIEDSAIPGLEKLAKWWGENADGLENLGRVAAAIATAGVFYKIAEGIRAAAGAMAAFSAAAAANPFGVAAAGAGLLAYAVFELNQRNQELLKTQDDLIQQDYIRKLINEGKTLEDLKKLGIEAEKIKEALGGKGWGEGFDPTKLNIPVKLATDPKKTLQLGGGADKEAQKKIEDAMKRAAEFRKQAETAERDGIRRIMEERRNALREFGVNDLAKRLQEGETVDDLKRKGVAEYRLKILGDLEVAFRAKIRDLNQKDVKEYADYIQKKREQDEKYAIERVQREQEMMREIADVRFQTQNDAIQTQIDAAQRARDAQLRQLEAGSYSTFGMSKEQELARTVAVEKQKASIEQDHLMEVFKLRAELLDRQTKHEIEAIETRMRMEGYNEEMIAQRRDAAMASAAQKAIALDQETQAAMRAAQEDSANRQAQLVRDAYQRQFDSIKDSAGRMFDAMLSRTRNFSESVLAMLRTAFLTPIKEFVSNWIAAMMMGQRGMSGGGGGFSFPGLMMGGMGMGGGFGIPGAPGGTPGFAGPVGSGGGMGNMLGMGGMFSMGGLKSFLGMTGSIPTAMGATTWQAATLTQKLGALSKSNAALVGGGVLAFDGLRRGGLMGMMETTAGGALIGAKFGGGIGAAIGAGVGAVAGLIRLFIKGAEDKTAEKIKSVYGVDLRDKALLKQIVDMAKQQFGGNIDMAIRTPQIREMIQLYAMSTGQSIGGMPRAMTPYSFSQAGGQIVQNAVYSNGSAIDQLASSVQATSASQQVVLKLDGPATTQLLQGEAVQAIASNPRTVQAATMSAARQNSGRREMLSLQMAPGLITG